MGDESLSLLREKTEEADLNTFLKTTVGGYTKKSVLDYLAFIKKQQQDLREAFSSELQRIQGEKEELLRENDSLEADLNEAMERIQKNEDELGKCREELDGFSARAEEKAELQKENASLEADLNEAMERIRRDERELEQCRAELEKAKANAEQSEKDAGEFRGMLDEANAKNEELNQALADLTAEPATRPLRKRAADLILSPDGTSAEEEAEEAEEMISQLLHCADAMQSELTARMCLLGEHVRSLDGFTRTQLQNSRDRVAALTEELQESMDQNELLESEKEGLTRRVSELIEQNVLLDRENTRLKAANCILQRSCARIS